ncbi:histidine kinase [uncultured Jatrophihabitans sp.]|uniref:histidine kinase n=1 Tax=uncultured Jatrophihabitans sp. TaxID=1610747 RepID=UPI0035C9D88E
MRWLLPALVAVCAALWIDALAGGGLAGGAPAVVVVAALSLASGLRAPLLPLAVAGAVSAALLSVADQVLEPTRFTLASDGVFYSVVVLAPALVGWLIGSRNRQVAELQERRRALEIRRGVAVRVARARERDRVERRVDLSLAGRLRRVVLDARTADELAASEPDRVPDRLAAVEQTAREALGELREVLGVLHHVRSPQSREPGSVPVAVSADPPPRPRRRFDLIDVALVVAAVPLAVETALPGHHGPAAANAVLSLAQGGALVLVRRRELPGVVLLLAAAIVQTAFLSPLPPTVSWLLPGLLTPFLVGLAATRRIACVGIAVLVAGVALITLATPAAHRALGGFAPGLVMGVLAWAGGRLAKSAEVRAQELRGIADELDRTREAEAHLAAAEQRAELARDLHDVGAHALTVVCLQSGAARAWWSRDPGQARAALDAVVAVANGTLAQLGESLSGLARVAETSLAETSLAETSRAETPLDGAALDVLAGIGRVLGLRVDIAVTGQSRPVADGVARVAYRVVQEALTNAARYAGGSSVQVVLDFAGDLLEVRIIDSGPDTSSVPVVAVTGSGSGLRGMRERVEALRGELHAGPSGRGFEILARLPA